MEKVLIFSTVQLWRIHHAEVIELVWRLTSLGKKVYLISCDGKLNSCPANPDHLLRRCLECNLVTKKTERYLLPDKCVLLRMNLTERNYSYRVKNFNELLKIKFRNLPIGKLVASQIADDLNGVYFDTLEKKISRRINSLINNGISLYLKTIELIDQFDFDEVYTWNGRRPSDGPPIYAAQAKNIRFSTFISGGRIGKILVSNKTSVHDLQNVRNGLAKYRKDKDKEIMKYLGKKHFLVDIHDNVDQFGFQKFNEGALTSSVNVASKPILLVVTSSPNELIHQDEWINFFGDSSPYETFMSMVNDPRIIEKFSVVVRWHPAKINAFKNDRLLINKIAMGSKDITHVMPEDKTNTYDLVKQASVILSFGSTVGHVAALLGKPVILVGPLSTIFKESLFTALTKEEVVAHLFSDLKPKSTEEIELFGYYSSNFGSEMKFVSYRKAVNGRYKVGFNFKTHRVFKTL
jgi:hypothetical protein